MRRRNNGLGDFLDVTSSSGEAVYNQATGTWDAPAVYSPTSITAPAEKSSLPTTIGGIFSSFFSSLTSPGVVTAGLNKYVFGKTAPIPTATNLPVGYTAPSAYPAGTIMGIPTSYLLIGGAAAMLLFFGPKRGRR